jgi:hypothetical protein
MSFIQHIIRIHSVLKYAGPFAPVENMQEALKLVMCKHIKSEIIGSWLYCFPSPLIGVQLLAVGFWYSKKHGSYVYSGYPKEYFADEESLDQIRARLGCQKVQEGEIYV